MADFPTAAAETYPHLTNRAAFVDRVVVEVWGTRRKRDTNRTVEKCNLPIGGPGRLYGRCSRRRSIASGNQLQIAYGVTKPFRNLSPFKMTIWAGKQPVLCSDVFLVLDSVMRRGYRARVSAVEVAFDVEQNLLDQFTDELCTRARLRDVKGTIYAGGVGSPWQVKFYKRKSVARVEFTLRSMFLRRRKINGVAELYLLRKLSFADLVSFCEVNQSHGDELPPRIKTPWMSLGHGLPPGGVPASIILRELRESWIAPGRWVVRSDRGRLLHKMQRRLIW